VLRDRWSGGSHGDNLDILMHFHHYADNKDCPYPGIAYKAGVTLGW
jgi:hypothetical protein